MKLDATSRGPATSDDWIAGCEVALDEVAQWKPVKVLESGVRIYSGYVANGCGVRSTAWAQEFPASPDTKALLQELIGEKRPEYSRNWDQSLVSARVLKRLEPNATLWQWDFAAAPLADRDLLYVWASKKTDSSEIHCYPSVSDAWAESHLDHLDEPLAPSRRTRSLNIFPSCDRLTLLPDGSLRREHLITTSLGGWVPDAALNSFMGGALVGAYAEEATKFRRYVDERLHGTNVHDDDPQVVQFLRVDGSAPPFVFEFELCCMTSAEPMLLLRARYSALASLRDAIGRHKCAAAVRALPPFPKEHAFSAQSPGFLHTRGEALAAYLQAVLESAALARLPAVVALLEQAEEDTAAAGGHYTGSNWVSADEAGGEAGGEDNGA